MKGHTKAQRTAAMILAVLLLCLFLATMIVGVAGGPESLPMLRFLIFADVCVPAVIYGFILITKQTRQNRNDPDEDDPQNKK